MKYILPFLLLSLFACKKEEAPQPKAPTGLSIIVKKNERLSTGEVIEKDVSVSVINIWKSTSTGDIRVKSYTDAAGGYAYDFVNNKSVKADYTFTGQSTINQTLEPGTYCVAVFLSGNIGAGSLAHTSAIFGVPAGQTLVKKKVFTTKATTGAYEEWTATE